MTQILLSLVFLFSGPVQQTLLEVEAERFAQAWSGKDISLLSEGMAEEGIKLHLPDEEHILIRPRQARAALEAFLGRYGKGEAQVTRVSPTGGNPGKGFAEILWRTSSPALSDPVIFTLFVGFSSSTERWTVTEIRVLF